MLPFGFGFDPTFILLLPAMAFAMWAQWKVQSTFNQYARVRAANGLSGRDMARQIMARNGVTDVTVEPVGGVLSDHYDPGKKIVRLSEDNFAGGSISSIAVAAHEVGHVLQHHEGYMPLQLRSSMAPVVGFASMAAGPLFLVGLVLGVRTPFSGILMDLGIVFFAGAVLFHLVTLPVEFDASRRAKLVLRNLDLIAPGSEATAVSKVLNAAAWTYVAAFITSLAYFLWHLLPLLTGRQRE
jgi:Zn-dependent membrane protease YugP